MRHLTRFWNTTPRNVSRALLAITSLAIASWTSPAARAQEGQKFTSNPEGTSLPILNELSSGVRYQNDLFAGQNKTGPYSLSWNNVRISRDEKVTIVVDGVTLRPDEFTVDSARGNITFARAITDKQVVRVNYIYDIQTSKRNAGIATSQFSLPVTQLAGTQVQVTALPDLSNPKAGALPLVWGANRKMNLMNGGLTTQFNFASGKGSGSKLGYAMGNDRNGINADFSRTEKDFATSVGKSLGMAEAAQKWSVATRLTPAKWFGLNYGSSASDDLTGNAGKENENLGLRLGGTNNLPTLAFTRTEATNTDAKKNEVSVTTEKVALDAKLNQATKVSATTTTTTTDAAKETKDVTVKENALAFNAASKDSIKKADISLNTNDRETATGTESKQDIKVRLQPAPVFVLSAGQSSQKLTPVSKDGKPVTTNMTVTQTAGAEIVPIAGAKITGAFSETARDDVRVSSTDFGAQLFTGKRVELTGGVTNRSTEVENQTALDTTRARIALKPWDSVTFTGSYIWNPEEQGRVKQALRQEFGLKAKVGALELGSGYALTTVNGLQDFDDSPQFGEVSLSLGLRFNKMTRLDGMYRDSLRYGMSSDIAAGIIPNYVKSYGFGLTHGLSDAFNFKLGGSITEDRNQAKDPKEMKAEAKLGVKF